MDKWLKFGLNFWVMRDLQSNSRGRSGGVAFFWLEDLTIDYVQCLYTILMCGFVMLLIRCNGGLQNFMVGLRSMVYIYH